MANISYLVRYKKSVDFSLLSKSINHVIRNNEGLRFRIIKNKTEISKDAHQSVSVFSEKEFRYLDFSGTEQSKFDSWIEKEGQKPFDLYDSELFDFAFIQFNNNQKAYLIKTHHLISDIWTIKLLIDEIDAYYHSLITGEPIQEQAFPSYSGFVTDEKDYCLSREFKAHKKFWLKQLLYAIPEVSLSSVITLAKDPKASTREFILPVSIHEKMKDHQQEYDISLFKQIFVALSIYVYKITAQNEFAISIVNHNRANETEKRMAGMFAGTLPIKMKIQDDDVFSSFSKKTSEYINDIIKNYSRYPFDLLVKDVRQEHKKDINHFLNIVLVGNENQSNGDLFYFNLPYTSIPNQLTIHFEQFPNIPGKPPELKFTYNSGLFDQDDIERLYLGMLQVTTEYLKDPGIKIKNIDILTEDEKRKILYDFNDTSEIFPEDKCIHELFEECARSDLDKIAIESGGQKITYGELDLKADNLARHLQKLGVGPETLVGLYVERSIEMVIGLLAILKSGGAYVPVEANLPPDRIKFMLEDTKLKFLLTQNHLSSKLPFFQGQAIIVEEKLFSSNVEGLSLRRDVKSSNLAYVIYTSGSTGKPKGVMVEHRSLVNLITHQVRTYNFDKDDRILHFVSMSFDAATDHLFKAICSGVTLFLTDIKSNQFHTDLKKALQDFKITYSAFPAPVLEALESCDFPDLKTISVGADKCSVALLKKWAPNRRFINSYGPTETTIISTEAELSEENDKTYIGKPIANTQIYLLDSHLNPVPIGVAGEMYIGGYGVSRGYLNRPGLTGEHFIKNPFTNGQNERMYKTGDYAKYLPDGNIFFIGRRDHQIKIRGHRVELGEIESVLQEYPGIKEAVVLVKGRDDSKKMMAYYTFPGDKFIILLSLKEFLQKKLPHYMIPSQFEKMESIPLLPNNKVDRNALQKLEDIDIESKTEFIAPETKSEKLMVEVWEHTLKLNPIGIRDNYFDLGGDSIQALLLMARIEKKFQIPLTPHLLFENPTIESLIAVINQEKYLGKFNTVVSIKKSHNPDGTLIFVHALLGNCWFAKPLTYHLNTEHTVLGIEISLESIRRNSIRSLEELAAFHIDQLFECNMSEPCFLIGYSYGGMLAFEIANQLARMNKRAEVILIDAAVPNIESTIKGRYNKLTYFTLPKLYYRILNAVNKVDINSLKKAGKIFHLYHLRKQFPALHSDGGHQDNKGELASVLFDLPDNYKINPSPVKIHCIFSTENTFHRFMAEKSKYGWKRYAQGGFNKIMIKGDHDIILKDNRKKIAFEIKKLLEISKS